VFREGVRSRLGGKTNSSRREDKLVVVSPWMEEGDHRGVSCGEEVDTSALWMEADHRVVCTGKKLARKPIPF
jgi:hypothetical protein